MAVVAQVQGRLATQQRAALLGEPQAAVLAVDHHQPAHHQLPEHRAPLVDRQIGADAEGAQAFVAQLGNPRGGVATQHVDEVTDAKALAGAVDARQRLARGVARIPCLGSLETDIAVAAGLGQRLAEVAQQFLAAAGGQFAEGEHRIEFAALDPLEGIGGLRAVDHAREHDHVLEPVHHPGVRGQTVAPGAAGLLVVGLDAAWQVHVRDEAHVRLVDAHAEGDGRDHDDAVLAQEPCLVAAAFLVAHAGVVGQGVVAVRGQPGGGLVDLAA